MQIKEVSVTYGGKLNLGDYNSAHVEVMLSAIADPDESAESVSSKLVDTAKSLVQAQANELIERIRTKVDEVFTGLPIEVQRTIHRPPTKGITMPIIGLTDRAATLPQIGTIRKGAAKPETGNRPGADLKHFRFDSDDADANAAFARAYGPEPVAIHAYLPFDSTDENFDAWKEEWVGGGLKHRCDGQMTAICLLPNGTYTTEPRPCPGGCKQVGRLKVIVPELRRLAFVTVMTTSIHDIMNIHSNLEALYNTRRSLKGIPLIVRRVPREISTPDKDGKRVRREKWLIHVEAQPQWVELQLQAAADAALPVSSGRPVVAALPAWDGDDDDDAIDPTVAPPPIADKEAEKRLEIQAKNLALTLHKGDKAAAAQFYAAHLDGPTFAHRQELYLALSSHDGLIQVVEQRLHALVEAGYTQDQIQKVLDGIGYGTAFDDMSDAQLITLSGEIYHETKGGKR